MRVTPEQYRQLVKKATKPSKYRNIKTEVDGINFDSRAEARRYGELKMLRQAGEIKGFMLQPSFTLPGGIRYRPDFMVCDMDGTVWVEDVKGMETKEFKIKKKLWEAQYPWLELRLIKN
ncbi:MAG: DUF1064 domain-containing protein [Defluviitaleaceae bacterium]|nr:DUF1064 domain-containing protein [Defluviitaleaceae bacterium]